MHRNSDHISLKHKHGFQQQKSISLVEQSFPFFPVNYLGQKKKKVVGKCSSTHSNKQTNMCGRIQIFSAIKYQQSAQEHN